MTTPPQFSGQPHGQGQPHYAGQPHYQGQPRYASQFAQNPNMPVARKLIASPIIMVIGVAVCIFSLFLTWNVSLRFKIGDQSTPPKIWNAFEQLAVNLSNGRDTGWFMLVSFVLAGISCVVVVISALIQLGAQPRGRALGVVTLIFAILGLIATAGMVAGYFVFGASDSLHIGGWVYGASFIPVIIGASAQLGKWF